LGGASGNKVGAALRIDIDLVYKLWTGESLTLHNLEEA
jgi:hypothetical protein